MHYDFYSWIANIIMVAVFYGYIRGGEDSNLMSEVPNSIVKQRNGANIIVPFLLL